MTDPKDMDFESRKEYDGAKYDIQEAKNDFRDRLEDHPAVSIDVLLDVNDVLSDDFVHPIRTLSDWCREKCKHDWANDVKFDKDKSFSLSHHRAQLDLEKPVLITMKFYFQDRDEAEAFKLRWAKDSEKE